MDSFGRPNLSVERGIRLAKTHLDEAEEALHAEQRTGERRFVTYTGDGAAPGAANTGQRGPVVDGGTGRVSWEPIQPDGGGSWLPQREMTPDEIRIAELEAVGERLDLVYPKFGGSGGQAVKDEVQRIIKGRIDVLRPDREGQPVPESSHDDRPEIRADEIEQLLGWLEGPLETTPSYVEVVKGLRHRLEALRPEQTSSEQVYRQPESGSTTEAFHPESFRRQTTGEFVPGGLPYRQGANDAMSVHGPVGLSGDQLSIGIRPRSGERGWTIPPYQVDQLRAIADGRPSWPEPSQPEGLDTFNVNGLLDWLIESVERRLAARAARR